MRMRSMIMMRMTMMTMRSSVMKECWSRMLEYGVE